MGKSLSLRPAWLPVEIFLIKVSVNDLFKLFASFGCEFCFKF